MSGLRLMWDKSPLGKASFGAVYILKSSHELSKYLLMNIITSIISGCYWFIVVIIIRIDYYPKEVPRPVSLMCEHVHICIHYMYEHTHTHIYIHMCIRT